MVDSWSEKLITIVLKTYATVTKGRTHSPGDESLRTVAAECVLPISVHCRPYRRPRRHEL